MRWINCTLKGIQNALNCARVSLRGTIDAIRLLHCGSVPVTLRKEILQNELRSLRTRVRNWLRGRSRSSNKNGTKGAGSIKFFHCYYNTRAERIGHFFSCSQRKCSLGYLLILGRLRKSLYIPHPPSVTLHDFALRGRLKLLNLSKILYRSQKPVINMKTAYAVLFFALLASGCYGEFRDPEWI